MTGVGYAHSSPAETAAADPDEGIAPRRPMVRRPKGMGMFCAARDTG